jgi:hypothetical protein
MAKPGRPIRNEYQPMWMLIRVTLAVFAYQAARKTGEKHSVAIAEAVKGVQETLPKVPISETEVKRIVARWLSKKRPSCLWVEKPKPEQSFALEPGPDGKMIPVRVVLTASFGPHPVHPRVNAAQRPQRSRGSDF